MAGIGVGWGVRPDWESSRELSQVRKQLDWKKIEKPVSPTPSNLLIQTFRLTLVP